MKCTRSVPFTAPVRSRHSYSAIRWASIGKRSHAICRRWALRPSIPGRIGVNGTKRRECIRTRLAPQPQRIPQSYLGNRYYVHSLTSWLDVFGGDPGLVLALRRELGTRSDLGVAFCAHCGATSGCRQAVPLICNREEAQPFYQSTVLSTLAGCPCPDQNGWQRASPGHYFTER